MKSLIQYLFEALVNGPELEKNLKFEETDIEEILDILDTDEYNHFADLTGERYDKDTVREGVFLLNNSTHFKIMYEGTLLGVFSVCLPENFKDLMNKREQSKYAENDFNSLETLFIPFLTAYLDGEPYDVIDKNIYKEFEDLEENLKKLGEIKDGVLNNKRKYGNEISEYF